MKTFGQLTDEVQSNLRSHVRDQELSTHLTTATDADDLSIIVGNTAVVSRGRIEIGDELIWVDSADREGTTVTIPPYGRGMDGTTAATHAVGDRVIVQPLFPRKVVKDAINRAIDTIGATLYGVDTEVLTPSATAYIYEMPAVTEEVLSVLVSDTRNGGAQTYLRKWSLGKHAPTGLSATGKSLSIRDGMYDPQSEILVVYSRPPVNLSASSDSFSVTLLPATSEDLVVLLASSRLLSMAEAANLQTRAVEANAMATKYTPGQALAQSKYLYQLYSQRLGEERMRLLNSTSNRAHYSR